MDRKVQSSNKGQLSFALSRVYRSLNHSPPSSQRKEIRLKFSVIGRQSLPFLVSRREPSVQRLRGFILNPIITSCRNNNNNSKSSSSRQNFLRLKLKNELASMRLENDQVKQKLELGRKIQEMKESSAALCNELFNAPINEYQ